MTALILCRVKWMQMSMSPIKPKNKLEAVAGFEAESIANHNDLASKVPLHSSSPFSFLLFHFCRGKIHILLGVGD